MLSPQEYKLSLIQRGPLTRGTRRNSASCRRQLKTRLIQHMSLDSILAIVFPRLVYFAKVFALNLEECYNTQKIASKMAASVIPAA